MLFLCNWLTRRCGKYLFAWDSCATGEGWQEVMLSCVSQRPCDHTSAPGAPDPHLLPDHLSSSSSYSPYSLSSLHSSFSSHAWHSVPPPSNAPHSFPTVPPPLTGAPLANANPHVNLSFPNTGGGRGGGHTSGGGGRHGFALGIGALIGGARANASGGVGQWEPLRIGRHISLLRQFYIPLLLSGKITGDRWLMHVENPSMLHCASFPCTESNNPYKCFTNWFVTIYSPQLTFVIYLLLFVVLWNHHKDIAIFAVFVYTLYISVEFYLCR